jgi:putative NADH-flavin reductase
MEEMKVAIIGASGRTGRRLVRESLRRGYEVVAVCRETSAGKLDEFADHQGFTLTTAPVVSDEAMLMQALVGCDAVVAVPITVRRLKATELVAALAKATAANGVKRLVFTAGEITAVLAEGETHTLRQRIMLALITPIMWLTPYSLTDMRRATELIRQQSDWEWTIVRAPTLTDSPPIGYRFCGISEVTSKHSLSREDYAACLLDSLKEPDHRRRMLTAVSAKQ